MKREKQCYNCIVRKNPKKAAYDKVYKKRGFSIMDLLKYSKGGLQYGKSRKILKGSRDILFGNS